MTCPSVQGWPQVHLAWAVGQPGGRAIWKGSSSKRNMFSASELNHPLGSKEASEFTAEGQVERPRKDWIVKVIEARTEEKKARVKRCSDEKRRLQNHMCNKLHICKTYAKKRYWWYLHGQVSNSEIIADLYLLLFAQLCWLRKMHKVRAAS